MQSVNIDYQSFEAGLPMEGILGVPMVTRAVLICQKNGIETVHIQVHAADEDPVKQLLESDERIQLAWSCMSETPAEPTDEPTLLGNVVFLGSALDELLSGGPPNTPSGSDFQVLSSPADRRAAENLLMASLVKDADGVISRHINRKISCFLSRRLASTSIHPNHVTAVVGLIGFAAFPLAMQGTWQGFALGGLCYYVSAILDGVDGELSRLKHLGSPLGAWLDTLTDDAVCIAWLLGLFWGLSSGGSDALWVTVGGVTLGSFLLTVIPRYWLMLTSVGAGDHQKIAAARKGDPETAGPFDRLVDFFAATVFRTDFLPFFAFVTALCGGAKFFAWSFAAGSLIALIETVFTVRAVRQMKT